MKKLILLASLLAAVSTVSAVSAADVAKDKKAVKPASAATAAPASSPAADVTISNAGSPTGRPADWRVINDDGSTEMSLDAASIRQIGSMREVWAMWNFKQARPNKGDPSFPALKSYQDMYILNCEDKTMRLSKEIIYAENYGAGDKRDHSDALTNMSYEKPAPDTVAETMVNEVCNLKMPKK
ncbi:surface-adhesin E family protein [Undibacterium sp. TJN25]|uniref:surface-adhesin E family protein n=1 Tax=Undibacterium sp. TJN25 TaxID=3413056 RepID=UPI003BF3BA74